MGVVLNFLEKPTLLSEIKGAFLEIIGFEEMQRGPIIMLPTVYILYTTIAWYRMQYQFILNRDDRYYSRHSRVQYQSSRCNIIQIWTGYEGNSTKYMPEGVRVDNYFTRLHMLKVAHIL